MFATTYIWQGIDSHGQLIRGATALTKRSLIITELQRKNILLFKLKKQYSLQLFKNRNKNITTFLREFATLITANIPLINALNLIAQDTPDKCFVTIITAVKNSIEEGLSLSAACAKYPRIFNQVCCNLINIGEKTGTLDTILNHLATNAEKNQQQKQRLIKALFYPAIVSLIASGVTGILLIFVIPQFKMMFANFGASLPWYTQMIMQVAEGVKNYGLFFCGLIIITVGLFIYLPKHFVTWARKIAYFTLTCPLLGQLMQKHQLAHIMRTLNLASTAGIPILDALQLTSTTISNIIYRDEMTKITHQIMQGKSLHAAMSASIFFPPRTLQFISIGEESGTLDEMLRRITEYYENEIKSITTNLNNLLEPLITIILGIIIGGIVIGMYLPIFNLGKII